MIDCPYELLRSQFHQITESHLLAADQGAAFGVGSQQGDWPKEGAAGGGGADALQQAALEIGILLKAAG